MVSPITIAAGAWLVWRLRHPLRWPAAGQVVREYGQTEASRGAKDRFHTGLDMELAVGTSVRAAAAGVVRRRLIAADGSPTFAWLKDDTLDGTLTFPIDLDPAYGSIVELEHPGGLVTRYAHLSRVDVLEGDRVAQGQPIGLSGATGHTKTPRLHFEVRDLAGAHMDPRRKLR